MTPFYLVTTRIFGSNYCEERRLDEADWDRTMLHMRLGLIPAEITSVIFVDVGKGIAKNMDVPAAYELSRWSTREKQSLPPHVAAYVAGHGFTSYDQASDDNGLQDAA